jgi:hypothetical protein
MPRGGDRELMNGHTVSMPAIWEASGMEAFGEHKALPLARVIALRKKARDLLEVAGHTQNLERRLQLIQLAMRYDLTADSVAVDA